MRYNKCYVTMYRFNIIFFINNDNNINNSEIQNIIIKQYEAKQIYIIRIFFFYYLINFKIMLYFFFKFVNYHISFNTFVFMIIPNYCNMISICIYIYIYLSLSIYVYLEYKYEQSAQCCWLLICFGFAIYIVKQSSYEADFFIIDQQ